MDYTSSSAFISSLSWQDVADIALNSYILFRLYVFFRGTNAFKVFAGIALLWILQRFSVYLGLILTSLVIQGIIAVAALVFIVIFRHEIRSVLQAQNLKSLFWGFTPKKAVPPVDIISECAFELAKSKTGALIVIKGSNDLSEIIHGGINWQGTISKEMIKSIFWKDNPVHDGAIIIQGDKITRVKVILPLSQRKDMPSYYGTRHRAAAGLAESTDALVIVVSEEKGNVLIMKGSKISVVSRKEDLIRMLQNYLLVGSVDRKKVKRQSFELFGSAIVSLLLVAAIWFGFTRGEDVVISFNVPIQFVNRSPGMIIQELSHNEVRVQLSGSGALIRSVRSSDISVRVDLSRYSSGPNTILINQHIITLPPGISLSRIEPQVVELFLDVVKERDVPVQADWAGSLSDNFIMIKSKSEPKTVRVRAGSLKLNDINTLYTEKILLNSITESGSMIVNLALDDVPLNASMVEPNKVTIRYELKKRDN